MLQAVLGLSADRMASAFLTSPAAMTKRLVRAKAKLAASGVRFEVPDRSALDERLEPVLDAIYAAFTLGAGEGCTVPDHPEVLGLQSLMLLVAGRRSERASLGLEPYKPLSEQDPYDWDNALLKGGEALLRRASIAMSPGRFQLEAAIQAVHVDRRRSGITDWPVIVELYEQLTNFSPSLGARIAQAAAIAQSGNPDAALVALDGLAGANVVGHQPYWATRAYALALAGRTDEAAEAYERAAGLTESQVTRAWLLERRSTLLL
jgi:RNA polymerase sigma-70 factor (ECF subfamily)